ncbi:MAG: hypothetical protein AAGG68_25835 [Bacteroidota bacterium]
MLKIRYNRITLLLLSFLFCLVANAQTVIALKNPSFEGFPRQSYTPKGWYDCGFDNETPPDVHPAPGGGEFKVNMSAYDGATYLGMVVRDNHTWEAVAQKLTAPLQANQCYEFNILLARSLSYIGQSRTTEELVNYSEPGIIRIWGGNDYCNTEELLSISKAVIGNQWLEYSFTLHPTKKDYDHIMIEMYYDESLPIPYNGNVLLDSASDIMQITCDNTNDVALELEAYKAKLTKPKEKSRRLNELTESKTKKKDESRQIVKLFTAPKDEKEDYVRKLKLAIESAGESNEALMIEMFIAYRDDSDKCVKKLKTAMRMLGYKYKDYDYEIIME